MTNCLIFNDDLFKFIVKPNDKIWTTSQTNR